MKVKRRGIFVPPTADEQEAVEHLVEMLQNGSRDVERRLALPDDDWDPVWIVLTQTKGTMFMGDAHKYVMVDMVADFAKRVGAIAIGHLHSTWALDRLAVDSDRAAEVMVHVKAGRSLEELPEAFEQILIAVYSATKYRMYCARIERHEGAPPTLGEYILEAASDLPSHLGPEGKLGGRMMDPLIAALRKEG